MQLTLSNAAMVCGTHVSAKSLRTGRASQPRYVYNQPYPPTITSAPAASTDCNLMEGQSLPANNAICPSKERALLPMIYFTLLMLVPDSQPQAGPE